MKHQIIQNFLNESVSPINSFKELFKTMPDELQKRVFGLKSIGQNPKWHPEGDVLKHTILVTNRAFKYAPDDIDLAIAAMLHDIGKDSTSGIHKTTGAVTHYGHEDVSAILTKKYSEWITSIGGNPDDVYFIVINHMKMKQFDVMKISKQRAISEHPSFNKLQSFSSNMDKGGNLV